MNELTSGAMTHRPASERRARRIPARSPERSCGPGRGASTTFGYARYLAAKTTVDDRALNRQVLAELYRLMPAGAPRVVEVGAGLGTMAARLMAWGAISAGEYVLLDVD